MTCVYNRPIIPVGLVLYSISCSSKVIKHWDEQTIVSLYAAKPGIGTENEALLAAAQELGLKLVLSKANADLSDIEKHLDQNHYVIVNHLHAFDGNGHYGLITEYDADSFYLRDSSFGFLRLKNQDFPKHWYNSDKTIPC